MSTFLTTNPEKITEELISFIKKSVDGKPVIIGLSGGIDSTVTCELAIRAIGVESIKALTLKNIRYSQESLEIVREYTKKNRLKIQEIDTNELRTRLIELLNVDTSNIQAIASLDARITDLVIRTIAKNEDRIYLGTINGSERLTGWYPKNSLFGDICPIGGLLKSEVQSVAKYLQLPDGIIESVSDDASKICSGCGELTEFKGVTYKQLDTVLFFYEEGLRGDDLENSLRPYDIPKDAIPKILHRIDSMQHKQTGFPSYPKFR